jgi:hypothetical protein
LLASARYKLRNGANSAVSEPKYPNVTVQLSGEDGNAFFIIGRALAAARRAGVPSAELDVFANEAMSGDYDNVLRTCMKWFDCH